MDPFLQMYKFLANQYLCCIHIKANATVSNFSWRIRLPLVDTDVVCFRILINLPPKIVLDYARRIHGETGFHRVSQDGLDLLTS